MPQQNHGGLRDYITPDTFEIFPSLPMRRKNFMEIDQTENKKPLPNQAPKSQNSIEVSWEFEPAEDAEHRLTLIFNLLLNNKLG